MGWGAVVRIGRWLVGPIGKWAVVVATFAVLLGVNQIQALRLKHAKADLAIARAAQYAPDAKTGKPTKVTWKALAEQRDRDLTQCQTNREKLETAIEVQKRAVTALEAETARRSAEVANARQAQAAAAKRADSAAKALDALKLAGADQCADYETVNRKLKEMTR